MKTTGESVGIVVAAMSIVGLLGVAGWSVYAGLRVVEEPGTGAAPQVETARTDGDAPATVMAPDPEALEALRKRVERLEHAQQMPEKIARETSSSVALVIGEYIWTDSSGRRPLRYQDGADTEHVGFDGRGPIVVRDFTGTGFLLRSGKVLTTGFVLSPWYDDPLLDESEQPERIPSIQMLHAYFPGHSSPVDLKIERAEENAETVLCSIEHGPVRAPGLDLSETYVQPGASLLSIGYPGGVPLLAARLPDNLKRDLLKFGNDGSDEVAAWLASHNLIQPVVIAAHVSALTDGKIFYEQLNSLGGTGGPLLDESGKVAAVGAAVNPDFPSVNLAFPVAGIRSWLDASNGK